MAVAEQPAARATLGETKGQDKAEVAGSGSGNLTTPEGICMMFLAVVFDVIGIILNILFDLNIITDTAGIIVFGGWALFRKGDMSIILNKNKNNKAGAAEDILIYMAKKFGSTYLIKIIPFIGSLFSFWTYRVYKILTTE
jgi:hypothetical protein